MYELTLSDRKAGSALCSAAGQDFAPVGGLHSLTEAVNLFALTLFRLEGTKHVMHSFRFLYSTSGTRTPEAVDNA